MTQNLLTITIPENAHKSLKEQTVDFPMFSVITGLNGSGKSHLLEFIDKNETSKLVRYIDAKYNHGLENIFKESSGTLRYSQYAQDVNGDIIYFAGGYAAINANELAKIKKKEVNSSLNNYSNDFKVMDECTIKKLFDSIDGVKTSDDINSNKYVKTINQRLQDFGLNDLEFNTGIRGGELSFEKDKKAIKAYELSTGEQLCVAIALWELSVDKDDKLVKTDLLLIDEPDAHLNPSLMKKLHNVLKKVSENGTRVIITTHNPVFINLGDKESLLWMDGGYVEKKHKNKHKETICNTLGAGLFTAKNLQGIFRLFHKDATMPRVIILYEGSNDTLNIEAMICDGENRKSDIEIISCQGAQHMPMFANLPYAENNEKNKPKIVCVIDLDWEGITREKM